MNLTVNSISVCDQELLSKLKKFYGYTYNLGGADEFMMLPDFDMYNENFENFMNVYGAYRVKNRGWVVPKRHISHMGPLQGLYRDGHDLNRSEFWKTLDKYFSQKAAVTITPSRVKKIKALKGEWITFLGFRIAQSQYKGHVTLGQGVELVDGKVDFDGTNGGSTTIVNEGTVFRLSIPIGLHPDSKQRTYNTRQMKMREENSWLVSITDGTEPLQDESGPAHYPAGPEIHFDA